MDDLLLAGTHQVISELLTEMSPDLQLKKQRRDDKNRRATWDKTLVKDKGSVTTSELMLRVRKRKTERVQHGPRSRAHQHCDGNTVRQMGKRCLQANEGVLPTACCKNCLWIDRADLRCAMVEAS